MKGEYSEKHLSWFIFNVRAFQQSDSEDVKTADLDLEVANTFDGQVGVRHVSKREFPVSVLVISRWSFYNRLLP